MTCNSGEKRYNMRTDQEETEQNRVLQGTEPLTWCEGNRIPFEDEVPQLDRGQPWGQVLVLQVPVGHHRELLDTVLDGLDLSSHNGQHLYGM
jgi:hypothetical protein